MNIYIFLLDSTTLGGIERVAHNLYESLGSIDELKVSIIDIKHLQKKFNSEKSEAYLCHKFCRSLNSSDIVISMYDRLSIEMAFLKLLNRKKFKLVASQHADYFANRIHTRILRRLTYNYVDCITALTDFDTSLYDKWHNNAHYIPNPILFYPDYILDFSLRSNSVVAAGRLNEIKQFHNFIDLAKLMESHDGLDFKIFGDGEEKSSLCLYANNLDLNSDDIIQGETSALDDELLISKFLIVTSKRESFSMVILEAMASGCIPISYDCPTGPRELIVNEKNGYLVKDGDLISIRNIITKLLDNPELAKSIQNSSRKTAIKYTSNVVKNKWKCLLDDL